MKKKQKIRNEKVHGERADGDSPHTSYKKDKNRRERRRAKIDPECTPHYGRYRGYET